MAIFTKLILAFFIKLFVTFLAVIFPLCMPLNYLARHHHAFERIRPSIE
jgi:hypothetical protein